MSSATLRACGLVLSFLLALAGCRVEVDYGDTRFTCSDGVTCPPAHECVGGVCLPPPADGADLPTCEQRFGDAPEYELCEQSPDLCTFATRTGGGTCAETCASFDSECITAYDNDDVPCDAVQEDGCDRPRSTEICVCTR